MNECTLFWALGALTGAVGVLVAVAIHIKKNLDVLVGLAPPRSDEETNSWR